MYEMVTGRVPFDGETAVTVAVKHLQEQMVPPSEYCPEIPYSLEQIIKKCTEKSPDRRYQDIGDLMADLKQSLVDPDGDFVQMVDLDEQAKTVIMTKGTTSKVKESRRVNLSKDEDADEDDEEEDEDNEDDEDDDEELSPTVERAMTIAGVVLAVIIVIIMLLLFSKVLGIGKESNTDTSDSQQTEQSADEEDDNSSSTSQGNTVKMPSLLGKTYAEARTVLEELGLQIERGESEKSNQYSAGQIIAQSEESGNSVKVGTTVTVTLAAAGSTASSDGTSSTGSTTSGTTTTTTNSKVTVPSVVGKDENAAKSAITAAGLTVGTVSEASSDTVESGLVISQSPSANSETESNGKVNIVLSSGPNKKKVTDVIGHESSRAQSELAGDGFKVEVKETYSNDMRAGLVVSTSPDRGTYVQPGSTVTITVSKGREQVTIPSVSVGMTYEEAVEALNDAGFKGTVKEATEYSASVGSGFVTRYSPSKTVDPDGTVTIYVSLGTQSTTE